MGRIKGQLEYKRFKDSEPITRKQAMLAQCYECNGFEASNCDCKGLSCPLYQFHPYRGKEMRKKAVLTDINTTK